MGLSMYKWFVDNLDIELSEHDYYNGWLGIIKTTCSLGGLLAGYIDLIEGNQSFLERHADHLHQNIIHVEDAAFRDLLNNLEIQFRQIVALDNEAVAKLAHILGVETPKSAREYKAFYRKYRSAADILNSQGYLNHPEFEGLKLRYYEISTMREELKAKIIAYIVELHPDLAQSEYL
jgi:hypothetical protein